MWKLSVFRKVKSIAGECLVRSRRHRRRRCRCLPERRQGRLNRRPWRCFGRGCRLLHIRRTTSGGGGGGKEDVERSELADVWLAWVMPGMAPARPLGHRSRRRSPALARCLRRPPAVVFHLYRITPPVYIRRSEPSSACPRRVFWARIASECQARRPGHARRHHLGRRTAAVHFFALHQQPLLFPRNTS